MLSRRSIFIQTIVSHWQFYFIFKYFLLYKIIRKPLSNNSNCRNDSCDSINECQCGNNQKPMNRFKSISSMVVRYIFVLLYNWNIKQLVIRTRQINHFFEHILDVQLLLQFINVLWKDYPHQSLRLLKEYVLKLKKN